MLVGLVSIIVIIVVLMYQKNSAGSGNNRNLDVLNNNVVENFTDNMNNTRFDPSAGQGEADTYKEKYDELKNICRSKACILWDKLKI